MPGMSQRHPRSRVRALRMVPPPPHAAARWQVVRYLSADPQGGMLVFDESHKAGLGGTGLVGRPSALPVCIQLGGRHELDRAAVPAMCVAVLLPALPVTAAHLLLHTRFDPHTSHIMHTGQERNGLQALQDRAGHHPAAARAAARPRALLLSHGCALRAALGVGGQREFAA